MIKVFTNGCFDMLHLGHLSLLKRCALMGSHVMVGIDSDRRVRQSKGTNRPINSETTRKEFLLNLKWVNDVVIFDTDQELEETVERYCPDYMIVGSDWQGKQVIGSEHAKMLGYFERIDEYSTTDIIKRITNG